jgi:ABC-type nitrate/sulfonate/bicarbonate transport system permease component
VEIIYAYAIFFLLPLWRFGPFAGHGLPLFFPQSLLCFAAVRQFLALNNLVPSFRTSSLQLFLGFQAGFLLPPRLPYRIRFGIVVKNRHCTKTL